MAGHGLSVLPPSYADYKATPYGLRPSIDVDWSGAKGCGVPQGCRRIVTIMLVALAWGHIIFNPQKAEAFARVIAAGGSTSATDFIQVEETHADPAPDDHARKITAADTYLKHIYAVYLGLRACTELTVERKDQSFQPSVSLEEARRVLKAIDAATTEVGVRSEEIWASIAPQATVTAEALKADPSKHVEFCHRMGGLFRVDSSNLQSVLTALGAKTPLIQKDY